MNRMYKTHCSFGTEHHLLQLNVNFMGNKLLSPLQDTKGMFQSREINFSSFF